MAMFPPNSYDQLTNINRGMPQVAQPATTTQMQPSPPSLRNFMNQQHGFGPQHGHFGGGHFGNFPPKMMPGLMPKSAGTGLDMFSNNPEMAKAAQQAAMMQYGQQPGLSQQDLQQKLSEQQLYGLGPNDQPIQALTAVMPPQGGGPLNQPNATMPLNQPQQSSLNALQQYYQAMGGTGAGFGQPTSVAMPAQNPYGQGQSSLSEAPQFGIGQTPGATFVTQPNAATPFGSGPNLASNNLMQQTGMK